LLQLSGRAYQQTGQLGQAAVGRCSSSSSSSSDGVVMDMEHGGAGVGARTRHGRCSSQMRRTSPLADATEPECTVCASVNHEGAMLLMHRVMAADRAGGGNENTSRGGLLADQMGLGKTHTVLLLLWQMLQKGALTPSRPALVVAPPRILDQWLHEVRKWAPLHQWRLLEAIAKVEVEHVQPASATGALNSSIHFITCNCFTDPSTFSSLGTYSYRIAVFDEARGFDAPNSRTVTHIELLRQYVGAERRTRDEPLYILAVLGTPISPNLVASAHLLSLLDVPVRPRVCEVAAAFRRLAVHRVLPKQCHVERTLVYAPLTEGQHRAYTATVRAAVLASGAGSGQRRSLALCAPELRRICQFAQPCIDTPEQPYERMTYHQLLAGSRKLQCLDAFLRKALPCGARVLLFCYSTAATTLLRAYVRHLTHDPLESVDSVVLLDQLGSSEVAFIVGKEPTNLTAEAVDWFEQPVDCRGRRSRLMVLSALAGGRGLNLPSATHVYKFEPLQSHRVDEQADARALRQTRSTTAPLHVIQLVAVDTIEHGQHICLWAKAALAHAISANVEARDEVHEDQELKERLLQGDPLLHLNGYAYGVCWQEGEKPPVKGADAPKGRDLTGTLPQLVLQLHNGHNCFDADEIRQLVGDLRLCHLDFICLHPKTFGCTWKWLRFGRKRKGRPLEHRGLTSLIEDKIAARLPIEFSQSQWDALHLMGLRTDHFVEVNGSYYEPCKTEARWMYPTDWSGHDLAGAHTTLVSDFARRPLHTSVTSALTEEPDWCQRRAQGEAFDLLRKSLTMQAVIQRRAQDAKEGEDAAQEMRRRQCDILALPRMLRSGHTLDDSFEARTRSGRRCLRGASQPSCDALQGPPMPAEVLPVPMSPGHLVGRFVMCSFNVVQPNPECLPFAGVVRDVAPATQTFTVHFEHEAFLRMDHSSQLYALAELNQGAVYLVGRDCAVEQWRARARSLDTDLMFKKESLLSTLRRAEAYKHADSLLEATELWLQQCGTSVQRVPPKKLARPRPSEDPRLSHVAPEAVPPARVTRRRLEPDMGEPHLRSSCRPDDGLACGTRVAVWWTHDRTPHGRDIRPGWYAGSVSEVMRRKHDERGGQKLVHVLYDDGDEVWEPIECLWHWALEPAMYDDQLEGEAVCGADLRTLEYALNGSELNLVEEEDCELDAAMIDEADRFNWKCLQRLLVGRRCAPAGRKGRTSLRKMVYDLDITADECDVIGRKLSAAERTRVADIAIGVKALRSAMQGGVPGKGPRTYHVPRKMSLLHCAVLDAGLRQVSPQLCVCSVSSSLSDSFTTLLLHLPSKEYTSPARTPCSQTVQSSDLLHGAAAVWKDVASHLRRVAFGLLEGGCNVASRGTQQFFGGFDANPHKAEAILRQAMGVHRGDTHVAGVEHNDLRVPTLIASSYVTHGQVPLGEWLSVVTLPRRKHMYVRLLTLNHPTQAQCARNLGTRFSSTTSLCRERHLARGMWAGASFAETFGDGLDAVFGFMSAHLTLALVAADENAGLAHLHVVPGSVRLHPLSAHTTYAFYIGGHLEAEARWLVDYWEGVVNRLQCADDDVAGEVVPASPGAALLRAASKHGDTRLRAAIEALPSSAAGCVRAHWDEEIRQAGKEAARHPAEFAFSSLSAARGVPPPCSNPSTRSPN
jgi:hypothetical protein